MSCAWPFRSMAIYPYSGSNCDAALSHNLSSQFLAIAVCVMHPAQLACGHQDHAMSGRRVLNKTPMLTVVGKSDHGNNCKNNTNSSIFAAPPSDMHNMPCAPNAPHHLICALLLQREQRAPRVILTSSYGMPPAWQLTNQHRIWPSCIFELLPTGWHASA